MWMGGCDEVGEPENHNLQVGRGVLAKILTFDGARPLYGGCEIDTAEIGK